LIVFLLLQATEKSDVVNVDVEMLKDLVTNRYLARIDFSCAIIILTEMMLL